jgi:hypothetical protein
MGGAISNDMFSAPYMGGVATLPVPDGMFDEPTNGGYRGGGLVAFSEAGLVRGRDEEEDDGSPSTPSGQLEILVPGSVEKDSNRPKMNFSEYASSLFPSLDYFSEIAPRKTERAEEYAESLERQRSPEERERRRKEDMWMALGQIGAKMATTPGSLLQAAGTGIGEALPGIREAAKERREDERAAFKELREDERALNKEALDVADRALKLFEGYNSNIEALADRDLRRELAQMGIDSNMVIADMTSGRSLRGSLAGAWAQVESSNLQYRARQGAIAQQARADYYKNIITTPGYSKMTPAEIRDGADDAVRAALSFEAPSLPGTGVDMAFDRQGNRIK